MKEILLFGGTTEGRKLAQLFSEAHISCTVCVATEYGESVLPVLDGIYIRRGRMNQEEMRQLMEGGKFEMVVDATHPYAVLVSENIRKAAAQAKLPYRRILRENQEAAGRYVHYVSDKDECIRQLKQTQGNILLTTGSKELADFTADETLRERLFVRVLPSLESIQLCLEQGLQGRQMIAMQGPFSLEMNEALLEQFHISYLVTKASGKAGGFLEKIQAAEHKNVTSFIIGREKEEVDGMSVSQICQEIGERLGKKILPKREITLVGIGMGAEKNRTLEVQNILKEADLIFGGKRLLDTIHWNVEKIPYYLAVDIIPFLKQNKEKQRVVIVFSGDTGFYSGAEKLYEELEQERAKGENWQVTIVPGMSTVSYLAARFHLNWQDAKLISRHGRSRELADIVPYHALTFSLLAGRDSVYALWDELRQLDCFSTVKLYLGYRLSYAEERLWTYTAADRLPELPEGMYACYIENRGKIPRKLSYGIKDEIFIRGKVPMTKEEIRELSLSKLRLQEGAVVYDIGSGTGSVAVECARLSPDILVYAVEKKTEAVELIYANRQKFGCSNINVIQANAPEGMETLPAPTHVFIGGSGGKLREILQAIQKRVQAVRVVVNAITLETVAEMTALLKEFSCEEVDVVQAQMNKSRSVGAYHLMQAENPVYILSFVMRGREGSILAAGEQLRRW